MKSLKSLIVIAALVFWACSEDTKDTTGVWVDDPAMAYGESSSSMLVVSSSGEVVSSSSINIDTVDIGGYGESPVVIPPNLGCKPPAPGVAKSSMNKAPQIKKDESYGVIPAITKERVKVLVAYGLPLDSAISQARTELFRELGLDSLLEETTIRESSLERTLYYVYRYFMKDDEFFEEFGMEFDIASDFADGKLDANEYSEDAGGYYCLDDMSYEEISGLYENFMPLGCYGPTYMYMEPYHILSNIKRKCAALPYCNENIRDTVVTVGEDRLVCKDYWVTMKMTGQEKGGVICSENYTHVEVEGRVDTVKYVCFEGEWRSMGNTSDLPASYFFNPDFDYGSFTDPRDGHVYRTTVYNGKTWLAQDIDYYDAMDTLFRKWSMCYKNARGYGGSIGGDSSYCDGASRYYTAESSKKACPDGWRLPTKKDWPELDGTQENSPTVALFSKNSYLKNTTDLYGLSLRTLNKLDYAGWSDLVPFYNYFWLEESEFVMTSDDRSVYHDNDNRGNGWFLPVRCIKE